MEFRRIYKSLKTRVIWIPYYPVFPYNWYKELKNNDINDIYNYLRSIPIQSIKQSE